MSATSATKSGSNSLQLPQDVLNIKGGSATGNPRNKCALQPGHSLMDWIRLGNSGVDLSGTRGRVVSISPTELAKHNVRRDAWTAIRGKVYNITRYMDFHPGGVDELMRGVGRDATQLFDEVHAWVNYTQLLQKCYIGPLSQNVKPVLDKKETLLLPPPPPQALRTPAVSEIVPRFDWIQTTNQLSLAIYTRHLCNPAVVIRRQSNTLFSISVQIAQIMHKLHLNLHGEVEWPPKKAQINSETGKIEINLTKNAAVLWPTYGTLTQSRVDLNLVNMATDTWHDFEVVQSKNFNHNSFEFCLSAKNDVIYLTPIAYHVAFEVFINGESVQKSYTPIDVKYLDGQSQNTLGLNFLIKKYDNGLMSQYLHEAPIGTTLRVSLPRGNLKLNKLLPFKQFTLLAAGSGITAFLNLIGHLLLRNTNKVELLHLMYFNQTTSDIWCLQQLEQLKATDSRFHFTKILSTVDTDNQCDAEGHISEKLLEKLNIKSDSFVLVCGPSGFNRRALEILKTLHFNTDENVHVFQG